MGNMSLDDILITPLARIATPNGDVLHAMKKSECGYNGFGEAYFSWVAAGSTKAWKYHKRMTMNVVVPMGQVRFVFYLETEDSFRVEDIGVDHYARITVPPGIWFGFKGLSAPSSLILNLADILHDPNEVVRKSLSDINYDWN